MRRHHFYSLLFVWPPIGWTVVLKSPNDHNWVILCIFNSLIFGVNFLLTGIRIFITAVELIKTFLWYVEHESADFHWSESGMMSATLMLVTQLCGTFVIRNLSQTWFPWENGNNLKYMTWLIFINISYSLYDISKIAKWILIL